MTFLRRNVLIFHQGALGDFVLTWPLAMTLGRMFPQSRIVYVTAADKAKLAERVLGVESSNIEAGWHALYQHSPALPDRSATLMSAAHTVLSFVADETWEKNVGELAPQAQRHVLHPRPPAEFSQHATQHLMDQMSPAPAVRAGFGQMLRAIAARGISFRRQSAGDVVIHPGSGDRAKCWPLENFLRLIGHLRDDGRAVRVLIGEVERERWPADDLRRISDAADVRQPVDYLGLLEEISSADAFVGNDSGPAHLSAMIGVPTLTLFGPTDPSVWAPIGPRVKVLRGHSIQTLDCEHVHAALRDLHC